jgi:hypothetical protein
MEKTALLKLLKTAAKLGANYGENLDLSQHIVHRTILTRNYLHKHHKEIRKKVLEVINGDPFATTTDLCLEGEIYREKLYVSHSTPHFS